MEKKQKQVRKAIFVNEPVFIRFKKMAEADGRKYSAFLEAILIAQKTR